MRQRLGLSDKLFDKLASSLGGEEGLEEALRLKMVDALSAIRGVTVDRAVELVMKYHGEDVARFLGSPKAKRLHTEILELISRGAHLARTRNRILLLLPTLDMDEIQRRLDETEGARRMVEGLDAKRVAGLLSRLAEPKRPKTRHLHGRVVVVERAEDAEALKQAGVDGYCAIYSADEMEFITEAELVIYAYRDGSMDFRGAENVVSVPADSEPCRFAPEAVLDWVRANRRSLEAAAGLMGILGEDTAIPAVLEQTSTVPEKAFDASDVEEYAEAVKADLDAMLREGAEGLKVEGAQVLELMAQGKPPSLEQLFDGVMEEGRGRLRERFGTVADIYTPNFPVTIDMEALGELTKQVASRGAVDLYTASVDAALRIESAMPKVRAELERALLLDYTCALGSFASRMDLCRPTFGDRFALEGGLHLSLVGDEGAQPVDYAFGRAGADDQIVLLTGANSGGKTTLMETIAQACLMSHMGLGARARSAEIREVDELVLFERRRNLDAGAFEDFLKGFMPLASGGGRALILADEVEAMTEPEAAAIILSTFIDRLKWSGSSAMLVTHMAPDIAERTRVIIDGIEASGLDDRYNLVVDRTPKRGLLARSTPELIVRRLAAGSRGDMRDLYMEVLRRFEKRGE